LTYAAKNGDVDNTKSFLQAGFDPNVANEQDGGQTPLHYACRYGHLNAIEALLEDPSIEVDVQAEDQATAMMNCAYYGTETGVELLLAAGADIDSRDQWGNSALMYASMQGNVDIGLMLVERGADVTFKRTASDNWTALHMASNKATLPLVQALLEAGADVSAMGSTGETALMAALLENNIDVAMFLVENGADVNNYYVTNNRSLLHVACNLTFVTIIKDVLLPHEDIIVDARDINRDTPLHECAYAGLTGGVKALLKKGADIDAVAKNNVSALMYAAMRGYDDMVSLLLSEGADANLISSNVNFTALHYACDRKEEYAAGALVANNETDLDLQDVDGDTPMHLCALNNLADLVKEFIKKGADMEVLNKKGRTAILMAATVNASETVDVLIAAGANVNVVDERGITALMEASAVGRTDIVKALLEAGAEPNHQHVEFKNSALHYACDRGFETTALALLGDNETDITLRTTDGDTPLHFCAQQNASKAVAVMVERNSSDTFLNSRDNEGWTPIMQAAPNGYEEVVEILLEAGANPNVASWTKGETSLHLAAYWGHPETVEILLENGADVNAKSNNSWTPLMHAIVGNSSEAAKLLIDARADLEVASEDQADTALMLAAYHGRPEPVKLLLQAGADPLPKTKEKLGANDALTFACFRNHSSIVALLLDDNRTDINSRAINRRTPLHYCAYFNNINGTRDLIAAGALINALDNER